jgi:AraC-like DNA-binding protein
MVTIGSLCSGYGGLDAAAEAVTGGTTAWLCEFDAAPSAVLAHHYPDVPNFGDLKGADWPAIYEETIMRGAPRKDERAAAMRRRYESGLSLAQVAAEFGCSRQTVYVIFKRRGWELHPRPPGRIFQMYNGQRYSLRNNGYYAATSGNRESLHRRVWIDAHGPIPDGWDIHHLDRDKSNNSLDNLEALPKDERARRYGTGCNHSVHRCNLRDCDEEVVPSDSPAVDVLTAGYP